MHQFGKGGRATWRIYTNGVPNEERVDLAWRSFATPIVPDPNTYGFRWDADWVRKTNAGSGSVVMLPDYYQLKTNANRKPEWEPVRAEDVPPETGLAGVQFPRIRDPHPEPYVTPEDANSCWKKPGPKVGPFQAKLGDGSVLTYYWYRFADQPAMLNADLTDEERETVQARAEEIHRHWKKDREYLPPPTIGKLAEVDPASIVTPPPGLEVGYVPIVTRQAAQE